MNTSVILSEIERLRQNNAKALVLEEKWGDFHFSFMQKGALGDYHFLLDGNNPAKKYVIAMTESMDDRNAHNPLILLLSIIQSFQIPVQQIDEKTLKILELLAPKILNKIASAGPFTLRTIPKAYYHALSTLYGDHTVLVPIIAHLERDDHEKSNLRAILKRLLTATEIYDYKLPNLIPVPILSFTTEDHRLMVIDSYDEVLDLVSHFAHQDEDLESLQTMFLRYEQVLRVDEELSQEAKFITAFIGNVVENGKSAYISRFLNLDSGNIQNHNTKHIFTNLESVGLSQYLMDSDQEPSSYQHFQLDVIDIPHEKNFGELLHEVQLALNHTNGKDNATIPTFWHISIHSDNPNKQLFLDDLQQALSDQNSQSAMDVKQNIMDGKLILFFNEFEHENNLLLASEVIQMG